MGFTGKPSHCTVAASVHGRGLQAELSSSLRHLVLVVVPVKMGRTLPASPLCLGVLTKPFEGALGWDPWLYPDLGKNKGLSRLPHTVGAHQQSCPQLTWGLLNVDAFLWSWVEARPPPAFAMGLFSITISAGLRLLVVEEMLQVSRGS